MPKKTDSTEEVDIAEVGREELTKLEAELRATFEKAAEEIDEADPDAEAVASLEALATQIDAIASERTKRDEAAAELANKVTELRNRVTPVDEATEEEVQPEAAEEEVAKEEAPAPTPPPVPAPVPAPQPEAIAAAVEEPAPTPITKLSINRVRVPVDLRPTEQPDQLAVTAAGDIPGFSAGMRFASVDDIGEAFAGKIAALQGMESHGRIPVATVHAQYPTERTLVPQDTDGNSRKINDLISPAALTASGGLCAPLAVSYALANISTADRPVRDALPTFNAARGGVRFITPPTMGDLTSGVGIWTAANDANPTSPTTKPCVTVTCGAEVSVTIDAITLCIKVGNFSRRTFPEQFATWYDLGRAAHARVAENNLLAKIAASSTRVTAGPVLGAARDLIEQYGRAATQYRNRHRMSPNASLTLLAPAWARNAARADLARQLPGDNTLAVADAQIAQYFSALNLNVSWYIDGETTENQTYGAQAVGVLKPWKSTVVSYLFHPGAFMFVDGGTLDLGVDIRDSGLNATNDVKSFMETFENVAFMGIQSIKLVSSICVDGSSGAAKSVACSTGS